MKYTFTLTALVASVMASPMVEKRQAIDFAAYNAIPILPDVAAPIGVSAPAGVVSYNPTKAASAAVVQATAGSSTGAPAAVTKREVEKRGSCQPYQAGNAVAVNQPDTAAAFQNYGDFASAAANANAVPGYTQIWSGLNAAAQDSTYMTYISDTLTTYDPNICAAKCNSIQGCTTFNIFYERDPSLDADDVNCPSPTSLTYLKCSFFGGALDVSAAKNTGQWRSQFQVVIAGSNAYTLTLPATPSGYSQTQLGTSIIDSRFGYMGLQTFPQNQPYDPAVCAAACQSKSDFDVAHGLPTAQNPDICNFFDAYVLYKNGDNGVFTCAYYTTAYGPKYATNQGSWDGQNNHYTIGHSFSFTKNGAPITN